MNRINPETPDNPVRLVPFMHSFRTVIKFGPWAGTMQRIQVLNYVQQ